MPELIESAKKINEYVPNHRRYKNEDGKWVVYKRAKDGRHIEAKTRFESEEDAIKWIEKDLKKIAKSK